MIEFLSFASVVALPLLLVWKLTTEIRFFVISVAIISTLYFLLLYVAVTPETVIFVGSRAELVYLTIFGPSILMDSLLAVAMPMPQPTRGEIAFGAGIAVFSFVLAGLAWVVRVELMRRPSTSLETTAQGGSASASDRDGEADESRASYRLWKMAIMLWPFIPILVIPLWEGLGIVLATSPVGMGWFVGGAILARRHIVGQGMRGVLMFLNLLLLTLSVLFWVGIFGGYIPVQI